MTGIVRKTLKRLLSSETGTSTTEYAIMLALIALICVQAINLVGDQSSGVWNDISTEVTSSMDDF